MLNYFGLYIDNKISNILLFSHIVLYTIVYNKVFLVVRMKVKTAFVIVVIFGFMFLSSCNYSYNYFSQCTVVFEENPNITISKYVYEVDYNSDLSVSISVPVNFELVNKK